MIIADNYDAFREHDSEQEAWLAKLPKCVSCGEPIQDDDLFDIGGALYHVECAEDLFKVPNDYL